MRKFEIKTVTYNRARIQFFLLNHKRAKCQQVTSPVNIYFPKNSGFTKVAWSIMRCFKMFSILKPVVLLLTVFIVRGSAFTTNFPQKFVPREFVDSYRGFSTDIVANEIFLEHSNTYGVTAASTFGIGYLLALINEGIFTIPNEGFDEALRVQLSAIGFSYRDLVESLMEVSL